ncbi:MAG TPA: helix-turn-helix domain-containing protein [Gaiellaceae bacterium]|nr:helix-turn-helix domain-containing protein [Gaiellaceae bacterium]
MNSDAGAPAAASSQPLPRKIKVELSDSLWSQGSAPERYARSDGIEQLLTAGEAAAFVGVHPNTIYLAAKTGALHCHRVGRLRKFTIPDLLTWTGGEPR